MSAALAIERHADADSFLAVAEHWLNEAEAENNLLLGMALNRRGRQPSEPDLCWASIHERNRIVGCACRTPPHPLALSRLPPQAVASLADALGTVYSSLNGVTGPAAEAAAFAAAWVERRGGGWQTSIRLRLHKLTRIAFGGVATGSLRKATPADLALAREWIGAYVRDTGLQAPAGDMAQRLTERGQLYFWTDRGIPRSLVAAARETRSGCSINTVYTPPDHRRHGYATAAVAALSDTLLRTGRRFCCLYTDAANPTANSIYARIGYEPIRDDVEIVFAP